MHGFNHLFQPRQWPCECSESQPQLSLAVFSHGKCGAVSCVLRMCLFSHGNCNCNTHTVLFVSHKRTCIPWKHTVISTNSFNLVWTRFLMVSPHKLQREEICWKHICTFYDKIKVESPFITFLCVHPFVSLAADLKFYPTAFILQKCLLQNWMGRF